MSKINYPIFKFANVPFVVLDQADALGLVILLLYILWISFTTDDIFGYGMFIVTDFRPLGLSFSQQFQMKNANLTTSGPL
jgi:hypothetical protein